MRPRHIISTSLSIVIITALTLMPAGAASQVELAREIRQSAGVHTGFIVHLNCGNAGLTRALKANDACVVHGLTRDRDMLRQTREALRAQGVYGPISVDLLAGDTLPYIDNTVNLLVADGPANLSDGEILRVLVPQGVAYVRKQDTWSKVVKPRPDNIDEWTHYMHDASNNAVAHDTAIGPLRHLQWDSSPRYSRHHEFTSSVCAVVTAKGRLFSIIDMGSRASIHMPPKWRLTARDAFNGIVLWERDIDSWFNHLWPLKDGPAQPPRRLVAVGDSVYVTLGLEAPVSRLDAATGRTLDTYAGTEFTEEILYENGTLFLLKNDRSMNPKDYRPKLMICWDEKNRTMKESEGYLLTPDNRDILALDAATGNVLWRETHPAEPLTLTADERHVFFHNWNEIVCLDRRTGETLWKTEPVATRDSMGFVYGPTLVSYKDVILFADGRKKRKIYAFAKKDGDLIWEAPHYPAGHAGSAEDLMVVDGLVWCGRIAGGNHDGVYTGRDPSTGEVKREFTPDVDTYWFHHRCYRAKATDKYILPSRNGIEFVDISKQTWEPHHWVRGACTYGILPANGLIYAPPSPCACYLDSKLSGFNALAPATQRTGPKKQNTPRLERGPAYQQPTTSNPQPTTTEDWPTYRHDTTRSGASNTQLPETLSQAWQVRLGRNLTSPVVAGARLYTADQDQHTLYALDAANGKTLWTYMTGARVDSPPTVHGDTVLFGCADGYVYSVRAADGVLAWRFRAAPQDQRLMSYGRLESVWPVHGSVLVRDNTLYCVAGRSTFLDGGLHLFRLDANTGRMLSKQVIYDQQSPQKDVKVLNMPTALPDVLSCDDQHLYMRSQAFDLEGRRVQTVKPGLEPFSRAMEQLGKGAHLFSPTGFLDSEAWHRSYWLYGQAFSSGCNWWYRSARYAPAGRLLAFNQERVYGFGRETSLFVWSHVLENHFFCTERAAKPEAIEQVKQWSEKTGRNAIFNRQVTRAAPLKDRFAPAQHWSVKQPPLHVRALVLTKNMLVAAGPADVFDEDQAFTQPFNAQVASRALEQDAAYAGQRGALLLGLSPEDGQTLCQLELRAPPVWDGMAAARGMLYICDQHGYVTCLGRK